MASGIFTLKNQLLGLIQNVWSGTTSSNAPKYVEYLVVAGGGGGGTENSGGGGAGGLLQGLLPIVLGSSYTVTIGSGGAGVAGGGANNTTGGVGLNTTFGSITAIGGGGGGSRFSPIPATVGGSGGGAGGTGGPVPGASGIFGQGNAGGGYNPGSPVWGGGGGGGAGSAGASSTSGICAGNGGAGIFSAISGTITAYAGGGGGGDRDIQIVGIGGIGGGGTGANDTLATSGSANSGGGGGGGGQATTGGSGGSGIVIVRYSGNIKFFSGGTLSYDSINNYIIHTFYASGTLAPLTTPITYGTTSTLTKSLRFRASNSAYLSRTPATASNRKTWTWSGWVKRGASVQYGGLFTAWSANNASGYAVIRFDNDQLLYKDWDTVYRQTSQVFRDFAAWYHIVVAVDTTQANANDRVKIYVNGVQVTAFATSNNITQNSDTNVNNTVIHNLGVNYFSSAPQYFTDGYLAEVNLIDGQQLTPQAFGQYDFTSGVWQPMTFVGTYGTNGFYLPFTNTTSTTTLGYDSSGNGNNFATNNISLTAGSTYDSMNDVPTLTSATASNYPVINPLSSSTVTLTNGNLSISGGDDTGCTMVCPASGKWYAEFAFVASGGGSCHFGVYDNSKSPLRIANGIQYRDDGPVYCNNSQIATYAAYTSSDTVAVAIDIAANLVYFYKNNTLQGSVNFVSVAGIAINNVIFGTRCNSGVSATANFGQRPFVYTPPTGFVALNTYNLPTPAIVRGNQYMDAITYNGVGGSQTIMNAGQFQPDLVWYKSRSYAYNHGLYDSVRGATAFLKSNSTDAETTLSGVTSFNSNGFTVGSDAGDNSNGNTFVAWQWRASNATAVSNTSGSITSSVSANTTSGFSIVTFNAGTGSSAQTVGHGLGVAPSLILFRDRTNAYPFFVWHSSAETQNQYLNLSTSAAVGNQSGFWGSNLPTSSVFGFTCNNTVAGSANVVAYCFAPIAGFSAFGSYTGNGSTNGPFIYCGFRPKFILTKDITTSSYWWEMVDSARSPLNPTDKTLYANVSDTEYTSTGYNKDLLSNGFKIRGTSGGHNTSGSTYIYTAFAENPFKYANAR